MANRVSRPRPQSPEPSGGGDAARDATNRPGATAGGPLDAAAIVAGAGWTWALLLLLVREHLVQEYDVIVDTPPLWGFLALPLSVLGLAALAGLAVTAIAFVTARDQPLRCSPIPWLAAAWLLPLIDVVRLGTGAVLERGGYSVLEPVWLVVCTYGAAYRWLSSHRVTRTNSNKSSPGPLASVAILLFASVTAGGWFYWQGAAALDNFMLGFHDFGHFARRVVNTWEGRGFLMESPGLQPFWDHFNPGLALLAPLWAIWPSGKLFVLLQAICLAAPSILVYAIARGHQAAPRTALLWSLAYLLYPPLNQLNLNYTYGWHPVSCALPLCFLTLWSLLSERRGLAAVTALLAASFNESVIVVIGCFALAMAIQRWLQQRFAGRGGGGSTAAARVANSLSCGQWLGVWLSAVILFIVVYRYAGFAAFQGNRVAAQLDPVLALRPRGWLYLLLITAPLGWLALRRGWPILLAAILPLIVLLTWKNAFATSIAFQHGMLLIPILFLAAIGGASGERESTVGDSDATGLRHAGAAALACLLASVFVGALPFSRPTLTNVVVSGTYPIESGRRVAGDREVGSDGHRALTEMIERVNQPDASVLATGRIAAHLLNVRRLEPLDEAINRLASLQMEAGEGRDPLHVFQWILLDKLERFQQSPLKTQEIYERAIRLGYHVERDEHGVVLLRRPDA